MPIRTERILTDLGDYNSEFISYLLFNKLVNQIVTLSRHDHWISTSLSSGHVTVSVEKRLVWLIRSLNIKVEPLEIKCFEDVVRSLVGLGYSFCELCWSVSMPS